MIDKEIIFMRKVMVTVCVFSLMFSFSQLFGAFADNSVFYVYLWTLASGINLGNIWVWLDD